MGCQGRSQMNLKLQWKKWIYMTDCFLRLRTGEPVSKIANILGLLTRVNNLIRVNLKQRFNFSCCEIMLDSGTRGLLSHRWLLRVLISITLLLGEFWICILDLKSKNSQINKLLEMGIRKRIFGKLNRRIYSDSDSQKTSECPSKRIDIFQYSLSCT